MTEALWAPWRMKYILKDGTAKGCIFCMGDSEEDLRERLILHVGKTCLVMMNRYPYNTGHLIVAPLRHCATLSSLGKEELLDLMCLIQSSQRILSEVMRPEGFNIGLNQGAAAGAGIADHMHFHIVPRWTGDTNYITVLGEVRVIPEHLMTTYEKLYPHYQELNTGGTK